MSKIIGIDLGTTYSGVSIWDEKRKEPIIVNNLRGNRTTPSIVSISEGEPVVGEDARQNLWMAPLDTVSQIKREMGNDFHVTLAGKSYNPQTISAFILRYLKQSAEAYLGEEVHDAVITVPAYFTAVQRTATEDAGRIAGLNVARLINEPTAAAIAYGMDKHIESAEDKYFAVYDLGGGTFDVSIIQIGGDSITVMGTGGDPRLGGVDMDEVVAKWAVRQIREKYGWELSSDDVVQRRIKVEVEDVKKRLVVSESTRLMIPMLTSKDGKLLNVDLKITRPQFEILILPLLKRSLDWLEKAVASAKENNQVDWTDLEGILLVGGPTRLHKIRQLLKAKLLEHNPDREPVVRSDINPDEVVAMGAAIVAAQLRPIGRPPEVVESMTAKEVEALKSNAKGVAEKPELDVFDVTGHTLGTAVGGTRFQRIIPKEALIPITMRQSGFTNMADYTTQLLCEVYQGEDDFVVGNTRIGEVVIDGLDPMEAGQQMVEIAFSLDINGTLTTVCTDLRTKKTYEGSFVIDPSQFSRVSKEEIERRRRELAALMPDKPKPQDGGGPEQKDGGSVGRATTAPTPSAEVPTLTSEKVPEEFRVYWLEARDAMPKLDAGQQARLIAAMNALAVALESGDALEIETQGYALTDTLLEVR